MIVKEVSSTSRYTTGEMAKRCGISVRTVQFYDAKGLLKPSEISEGGRRLYSDDDSKQMQTICLLKTLGLSLGAIKGLLASDNPRKVLLLLLEQQAKLVAGDMEENQNKLETIRLIRKFVQESDTMPIHTVYDVERMMDGKKKLKRTHATMLAIGIAMDAAQIWTLLLWILKGTWLPFAIGMPIVIAAGILTTWMYCKDTDYICPECETQFKPSLKEFLSVRHTARTRRLKCPHCGYFGYCVEVYSRQKEG
jgi:DNA-binding transcriptional MerR regulator/DNA-directed RNA polymerase subunit RPC12/RpoP